MAEIKKFLPDSVYPPGSTIAEYLEENDWSQDEFAVRTGFSPKHISHLISGKATITEDTAQRLEKVLGSTISFWLNLETNYRNHKARIEAQKNCAQWVDWLKKLPIKDLKERDVLPSEKMTQQNKTMFVEKCLKFFRVASPEQYQTRYGSLDFSFRRSLANQTNFGAIATWLRLGEIATEQIDNKNKYNRDKFVKTLPKIRALTTQPPHIIEKELKALCAECGVSFVMVPAIPKAKVSGAARWLNSHTPLIQLSLYGKTNDKFWFTFFHEAAHILLHTDKKERVYLDSSTEIAQVNEYELEADQWASNLLIPVTYNAELQLLKSKHAVKQFAQKIDIHPGIVVGRLQHDKFIQLSWMNDLKDSFDLIHSSLQK